MIELCYSQSGYRHFINNVQCQDAAVAETKNMGNSTIFRSGTKSVSYAIVADGCSNAEHAVEAANINIRSLAACFLDRNFCKMSTDEKRKAYIDDVYDSVSGSISGDIFDSNKNTEEERNEFSATVSGVALYNDGNYLTLSVGDGTIVAFDENFNFRIISRPYNFSSKNNTCFTINRSMACDTMYITSGNIEKEGIVAFAVFTDGAERFTTEFPEGFNELHDMMTETAHSVHEGEDDYKKHLVSLIKKYTAKENSDDAAVSIIITDNGIKCGSSVAVKRKFIKNTTATDTTVKNRNIEPMYSAVLQAVRNNPLTPEELISYGICREGMVMSTLLPLIESSRIIYKNGRFSSAEFDSEFNSIDDFFGHSE